MKKIKLFTDSSVNPQEKIGYSAFLLLEDENISFEEMQKDIESMAKFIDEPINKVYIQDYTVGQIRDLARKV